jgi:hypothetical protein
MITNLVISAIVISVVVLWFIWPRSPKIYTYFTPKIINYVHTDLWFYKFFRRDLEGKWYGKTIFGWELIKTQDLEILLNLWEESNK